MPLLLKGTGLNVLKPHSQTTIFTLLEAGTSQRDIERVTGIDRKTIRTYTRRRQTVAPIAIGQQSVMPNAMQASDDFEARQLSGLTAVFGGEFSDIDQR